MRFWKQVAAYLTGWMIVQPTYNRLFNAWRRREMARPDGLYQTQLRDQARAFMGELNSYEPERPPAALEVIVAQHHRIKQLEDEQGTGVKTVKVVAVTKGTVILEVDGYQHQLLAGALFPVAGLTVTPSGVAAAAQRAFAAYVTCRDQDRENPAFDEADGAMAKLREVLHV